MFNANTAFFLVVFEYLTVKEPVSVTGVYVAPAVPAAATVRAEPLLSMLSLIAATKAAAEAF